MLVNFDEFRRIVVAIDPAVTSDEGADDTGIVVVAHGPHQDSTCKLQDMTGRCPGHGYVLADLTCHLKPHAWARRAIAAYERFQADRIVAEVNNGGDLVEATIHAVKASVAYKKVNASRGKHKRAEPVAALWEQGRMHLVTPCPELEDEMTSWTQDAKWSPNRLDAMVWGFSALGLIAGQGEAFLSVWKGEVNARKTDPDKQKTKEEQQLARIIKLAPRYGAQNRPVDRNCEHRWRGDICVFCGQSREAVADRRGGLRG